MMQIMWLLVVGCFLATASPAVTTERKMARAKELMGLKKWSVAIGLLRQENGPTAPASAEANVLLGQCDLALNDPKTALKHFGKATKLKGSEPFPRMALEGTADSYVALGEPLNAWVTWNQLLGLYPERAVYYMWGMSRARAQQKAYPEALVWLKQAIAKASDMKDKDILKQMREDLAGLYRSSGDVPSSVAVLKDLIARYPNNAAQYWFDLAGCYDSLYKGKFAEQLDALDKGVAAITASTGKDLQKRLRARHASVLYHDKQFNKAVAEFSVLVDDYPDSAAGWKCWIGRCYKDEGRKEDAQAIFLEIISKYPGARYTGEASCWLAKMDGMAGDIEHGLLWLDQHLEDCPEDEARVLMWKGEVLMEHGKYAEAIVFFNEQLRKYPQGNAAHATVVMRERVLEKL